MGFRCLVRDQEVDGSNPFAPTTVVELAIYRDTNARGTPGPGLGGKTPNEFANGIAASHDLVELKTDEN
jgi:hypothetical protein